MTAAAASAFDLSSLMVSQPQTSDRTLAIRRPSSVASRSTQHTRRHRSSRSYQGGSGYLPQNEFPNFAHTGDVEIVVAVDGEERRYLLHRLILAQCSGFFQTSTSEEWSRARAQPRGQGGGGDAAERSLPAIGEDGRDGQAGRGPFWSYELDSGGGEQDDEVPMLVQKTQSSSLFGGDHPPRPPPPPVRNKPMAPTHGFFRSISAMQSVVHVSQPSPIASTNEIIRDYDNLFRTFYNHPPALDNINITEAYIQCKTLLSLADMYDALEVVGPRIDHHLLQFQSRLWKQIAKYPPSYLKLGYLARSKAIFSEALIHVVGQWPLGAPQLRNMPAAVLELIEDKVDDLDDLRAKIEGRLFRLGLTTSRGERVTPANAYLDWMAVSLFRQWLAENTAASAPAPPPVHKPPREIIAQSAPPPPLPPGRAYRLVGSAGQAYLAHDELKRFLKLRPDEYSREALRKFERRMDDIKAAARDLVRPLMRNCLELDLGRDGGGLGYLTSTRCEDGDFPW